MHILKHLWKKKSKVEDSNVLKAWPDVPIHFAKKLFLLKEIFLLGRGTFLFLSRQRNIRAVMIN